MFWTKYARRDSNPEPLHSWTESLTIRPEKFLCHVTIIIILINLIINIIILWCVGLAPAWFFFNFLLHFIIMCAILFIYLFYFFHHV